MSFNFFHGSEDNFYAGSNNGYNLVQGNFTRWGSPDPETVLKALQDDYNAKYVAAKSPDRKTSASAVRKAARKALTDAWKDYGERYLFHNPNVTLEDKIAMGIHIPKEPVQKPVPTTIPVIVVILTVLRQVAFKYFKDASQTKNKHPGKPENVDAFVVYWAILDREPTSIAELINRDFATRGPLTLNFSEEDRGKRLYYVACWEINRDRLKGPMTEIRMVIIP
jgi:hypothetical protein